MGSMGFHGRLAKVFCLLAGLVGSGALCGCVAVGYSSSGGWFVWPSAGVLLVLLLLFFLLRRR